MHKDGNLNDTKDRPKVCVCKVWRIQVDRWKSLTNLKCGSSFSWFHAITSGFKHVALNERFWNVYHMQAVDSIQQTTTQWNDRLLSFFIHIICTFLRTPVSVRVSAIVAVYYLSLSFMWQQYGHISLALVRHFAGV